VGAVAAGQVAVDLLDGQHVGVQGARFQVATRKLVMAAASQRSRKRVRLDHRERPGGTAQADHHLR
jgi:hypothetical protein